MELTPVDRLYTFLALEHPGVKLRQVTLDTKPGFIIISSRKFKRRQEFAEILSVDIRGVGYPSRTAALKLWKELHTYFNTHVDVVKAKHSVPTKIMWEGRTYALDYNETFKKKVSKREKLDRQAIAQK